MTAEHVFNDTNILVYAHDLDAGDRHAVAAALVRELWSRGTRPSISVQVLQECYTTLVRKKIPPSQARDIVSIYMRWNVVSNTAKLLTDAMGTVERWKLSLWDALIIAAARRAGATQLLSEDLNEGQDFEGVIVVNPLRP